MILSDVAAERAVLGGIYQYGKEVYYDVCEFTYADTFSDTDNQVIFTCFKELIEKRDMEKLDQASLMSVAYELGYSWLFDKRDKLEHLKSILNTTNIYPANVRKWAAKLRKLQIARVMKERLAEAGKTLEDITGQEPIDQILGIAETAVLDFSKLLVDGSDSDPITFGNVGEDYVEFVKNNPRNIVGISTGYPIFDHSIGGGLRRGSVSLIGARTKVGKSQLSINVGLHIANSQIPVLYVDTEMGKEDHLPRILSNITFDSDRKVIVDDIETGGFSALAGQEESVRNAAAHLKSIPFDYKSVNGSFEEILSMMRRWLYKRVGFNKDTGQANPCVIIYDYIRLIDSSNISRLMSEYQALGFLLISMHNFAKKYQIPILAFSQTNREGISEENEATISGSDRILWIATNYSIYKKKEAEELAQDGIANGNRKLVQVFSRHGEGLEQGDYINMHFYGKYAKIIEGTKKHNLLAQTRLGITGDGQVPFGENNGTV